ncbi:S8 family serine peptidase [Sphingomonas sp. CGMCC 1.13654]|uniref:S8 family serine peptidase n=1 Tax=Sphingomonas chungangi TaxID=2683589 RepID=A0A838LAK1_9SPHN|nr:S8 family serine peptidase [Sphingomonas chungangi]MVW57720.1 S8 family serine peptidase [Sphingomonas chungangi]
MINVSWNRSPSLYACATTSAVPEMAPRHLFECDRDQLYQLMADSSEVLFVVAAGNSDLNIAQSEFFPAAFDLPNVIVAGAVDQMGNMATFTNYGAARMVYAEGCDIMSCAPGGVPLTLSGTSVAAAKVTSLAAKLLALRPELTPSEIVEHVMRTGLVGPDGTRSIDVDRALALI